MGRGRARRWAGKFGSLPRTGEIDRPSFRTGYSSSHKKNYDDGDKLGHHRNARPVIGLSAKDMQRLKVGRLGGW